jgi:catechol 2,3-dioxygenase-like lactoylglutathione lyase family enzyme
MAGMTAIATYVGMTVDCADPAALSEFYRAVTGWDTSYSSEQFVYLTPAAGGAGIGFQKIENHPRPGWPDDAKQFHLEVQVADLAEGEKRLVELGAAKPEFQPGGDKWVVLTDPAGHPFCISVAS